MIDGFAAAGAGRIGHPKIEPGHDLGHPTTAADAV